jgi:tetratricopeptide (TPR) repeat protein
MYLAIAMDLGQESHTKQAVSHLERMCQVYPDSKPIAVWGYIGLAHQASRLETHHNPWFTAEDEMLGASEPALRREPGEGDFGNRFDEAAAYLEQALELFPEQRSVILFGADRPCYSWEHGYVGLARQAGRQGLTERADAYLKRVLEVIAVEVPGQQRALLEDHRVVLGCYVELAQLTLHEERFEGVSRWLERAMSVTDRVGGIAELPKTKAYFAYGYIVLAVQSGKAKRFGQASSYLERALQIAPDLQERVAGGDSSGKRESGYAGQDWLGNASSYDQTFDTLAPAPDWPGGGGYIRLDWPSQSGYIGLATEVADTGHFEQASSYLERALQIAPDAREKIVGTGETKESGHLELEAQSGRGSGYLGLAVQSGKAKHFEQASSYLERALQIAPDLQERVAGDDSSGEGASGYTGLARLAAGAGRRDLARVYLNRCRELGNKSEAKAVAKDLGIQPWWLWLWWRLLSWAELWEREHGRIE